MSNNKASGGGGGGDKRVEAKKAKLEAKKNKKDEKQNKATAKRNKKEANASGERDIESILQEFRAKEAAKSSVTITLVDKPPSPRSNASITSLPNGEVLLFGGGNYSILLSSSISTYNN